MHVMKVKMRILRGVAVVMVLRVSVAKYIIGCGIVNATQKCIVVPHKLMTSIAIFVICRIAESFWKNG